MAAISSNSSSSDSSLIRAHTKELVHVLSLSKPARQTLTIALYAQSVVNDMEKLEIMESPSVTSADKLVGYISMRIDNRENGDKIWNELDKVEALRDVVKEMKLKRGTSLKYSYTYDYNIGLSRVPAALQSNISAVLGFGGEACI